MATKARKGGTAKVPYLLRRNLTWYVRYQVPLELQRAYGKAEVVRTLGTTDKRDAAARLHAAYAAIQKEVLEAVSGSPFVDYASPDAVAKELDRIREAVLRGDFPEPEDPAAVPLADMYVGEVLDQHYATHARRDPDTGEPVLLDRRVAEAAGAALQAISDPGYKPLSQWAADHLASIEQDGLKKSTLLKRKRFIEEFTAWGGSRLDPRRVTVGRAVEYTDYLRSLDPTKVSPRVKKDALTNLHTFFEWLKDHRRVLQSNPFHGLSKQIEGRRSAVGVRRPWTRAELVKLLSGLNPASRLWTAVVLALYTGMRVDEISGMEVKHVDHESLFVQKGKNDNSIRHVPIHPVIAPLVATLAATSYDGYLISGITPTGYDKKHGVYISKRFSIQRPNLDLTDPATTFHSLRHNFTSAAENAEIPETTVALLTGHKRQNITFGRYSEGREWTGLVNAMARITHRSEVDDLVASAIRNHHGNEGWRRKNPKELVSHLPDGCGFHSAEEGASSLGLKVRSRK